MRKQWSGIIGLQIKRALSRIPVSLLLLALSLLLNTPLFAQERVHPMGILLVAVGEVDRTMIEELKNDLNRAFNKDEMIGKDIGVG
jgi:hypothetical protein